MIVSTVTLKKSLKLELKYINKNGAIVFKIYIIFSITNMIIIMLCSISTKYQNSWFKK